MFDETLWADPLLDFLMDIEESGIANSGRKLATNGKVTSLRMEGPYLIHAEVEGKRDDSYYTELNLTEGGIETNCSCFYGVDCQHAHALAMVLVGEAMRRGAQWGALGAPLLPRSWHKGTPHALTLLKPYLKEVFGEQEPAGAAKPAAQQPPEASDEWWLAYLDAPSAMEQQEILRRAVRRYIPPKYGLWIADDLLSGLWYDTNHFDRLRRLAQALRSSAAQQGPQHAFKPDPALEAFLASDQAREMEEAQLRRESEEALLKWLREKAPVSFSDKSEVEFVWTIAPPSGHRLLPQLAYRVLLTTKKLRRSSRSFSSLEQLCREVENGRRSVDPASARLLRWLLRSRQLDQAYDTIDPFDNALLPIRNAVEWITLWGTHSILNWEDGTPVVFAPEPARLTIGDHAGRAEWSVAFPGDNGQVVALPDAQICSDRGAANTYWGNQNELRQLFARHGNRLHLFEAGGMPDTVLIGAMRIPEVPVQRLRGTPEGARLASRLAPPAVQTDSNMLVEEVPVRPVVECRMEGNTLVSIGAHAEGVEGMRFIWNHLGEWERAGETTTPSAELESMSEPTLDVAPPETALRDALAYVPRAADVEPLNAWLDRAAKFGKFGTSSHGGTAIEWRVRGQAFYDLLDLWAARPQGVTYLGDRAFRSLVTPSGAPRLHVNTEPSGTDWLKVSVEMEKEIGALSLDEIATALQSAQHELVYLTGGRLYRREDLEAYQRQVEALEELGIELQPGEQRVHAMQFAGARSEALEELAGAEEHLRALEQRARDTVKRFKGIPQATAPEPAAAFLRSYQKTGVDFLVWAARTFGGAVLADDMGLGKTLQILAALATLKAAEKKPAPSLVVCPASVAHNWQREAARFTPDLRVVVIERGSDRKKILDHLEDYDLVIKNYALTRREAETLREREWLAVCVDEAQAIKNPAADITRTVKSLPSKYRFALTGTPIENRLTDLWSIVDFALPGYLHSLNRFEQRLKSKDTGPFQRVVRARLRPILLRRTKAEVAPELPPRIEERRDCNMTTSQRKAYITEVQKTRILLDGLAPNGKKAGQARIKMLAALTRLRQICCDPALVGLPDNGSGKVDQLLELLPPILEQGNKVLLFSQFVRMLKRLESTLKTRKIRTRMLTGETTHRQDLVDAFESDPEPSVFLISLKAGGVGLNLPSASHVILFDPWWNPAVEAQAIDRTHRIGQDKTVLAFRLVSTGTVEERILELQERKRTLVTEILEEEAFNRTLTKDDFAYLLETDL